MFFKVGYFEDISSKQMLIYQYYQFDFLLLLCCENQKRKHIWKLSFFNTEHFEKKKSKFFILQSRSSMWIQILLLRKFLWGKYVVISCHSECKTFENYSAGGNSFIRNHTLIRLLEEIKVILPFDECIHNVISISGEFLHECFLNI